MASSATRSLSHDKNDPFEAIQAAQEGDLLYYPPYEIALQELQEGAKQSCWMWYICPSLAPVRRHRMPSMLLPNLEAYIHYLQHPVLGSRIVEITRVANEQLRQGVSPMRLWDGELDSTKFHETCTAFAIAAAACQDTSACELFVSVVQEHYNGLEEKVVNVLKGEQDEQIGEWIRAVLDLANKMQRKDGKSSSRLRMNREETDDGIF